ncbi:phage adaptor protein [Vreelandella stevensii]|uniref:phage adaptor protein n=1 Tax=Vreelandella stevensii TaxID=502821 RepID=UPI00403AC752
MTFLELCQRLRQEVGAAGNGPAAVNGQNGEALRLVNWIRQAWLEIQSQRTDWGFAWAAGEIEMENGYREYALPDNFATFIPDTVYLGSVPLKVISYPEFRRHYRQESPGQPRYITVKPSGSASLNSAVELDATPGATEFLTFEYYRTPQLLAANNDTPRLPAHHHMAIVYRAMIQYGLYENAPEVVQQGQINLDRAMNDVARTQLPAMKLGGPLA